MATTYPGTIDSFTNPSGTSTLDSPDHSLQHSDANDAIEAIEAVIGTTAGTSVLKDFSAGEFPARVNSGGTITQTLTGGTINATTLGTPTIEGGSYSNATLGTPTVTGGSFASPTTTGTDAGTATLTNKTLTSPLYQGLIDGWVSANETWEYVSVDDPTGIFRVNADVTGKYSAGMRIKFTNGTYVIYGIVTVVGSYSGGYTSITFLHQIDPTDSLALYLMANSAITANYYSTQKSPFGFPLDPAKWSVEYTNTNDSTESSPTQNVWYNTGSHTLSVPIGVWIISYSCIALVSDASSTIVDIKTTLSTANNSESHPKMTKYQSLLGASGTIATGVSGNLSDFFALASKTSFYLNFLTRLTGMSGWDIRGQRQITIIRATCAYL